MGTVARIHHPLSESGRSGCCRLQTRCLTPGPSSASRQPQSTRRRWHLSHTIWTHRSNRSHSASLAAKAARPSTTNNSSTVSVALSPRQRQGAGRLHCPKVRSVIAMSRGEVFSSPLTSPLTKRMVYTWRFDFKMDGSRLSSRSFLDSIF